AVETNKVAAIADATHTAFIFNPRPRKQRGSVGGACAKWKGRAASALRDYGRRGRRATARASSAAATRLLLDRNRGARHRLPLCSPDERSDIRARAAARDPACRFAHAGLRLELGVRSMSGKVWSCGV